MTEGTPAVEAVESEDAPRTGDLVIDGAVAETAAVDPADLDGVAEAGERLHSALQSRLSDLGS